MSFRDPSNSASISALMSSGAPVAPRIFTISIINMPMKSTFSYSIR